MRNQAFNLLKALPSDRLQEAVVFLRFLREKEEWEATSELTGDAALMKSWRRGRDQVRRGKTTPWRSVRRRV
ncbi:MAG: hypothetical protein HYY13_13845 [Nitrospirae bacterium]|nr:hypothetical protein [Nitrospirota bacterium]